MILTLTIFLPLIFGILVFGVKKERVELQKWIALTGSALTFGLSLFLFTQYSSQASFQFEHLALHNWLGQTFDTAYRVALDGFSMPLFLLTGFLFPLTIIGSWNDINHNNREYLFLMLMLETGVLGVFAATDLFLFYLFWEAMLIPMYFIIGLWGGKSRIYAATKYFIYTLSGSLLMLIGIIYIGYLGAGENAGVFTTDYQKLLELNLPLDQQLWLFWIFGISFFIKVPLFPVHTWLPDAHTEAPTAGSVILAGVLLKMGTYALIRFNLALFPLASHEFSMLIAILSIIGIIYGALLALVQTDIKRLVAYSSVSHLGFVVLGLFAFTTEALQGAILQMVNHGLSTGLLFMLIGMIYSRRHTRFISEFGGIKKTMPVFTSIFLITTLASVGLPGLNGFVGEFLILSGSFKSLNYGSYAYAILASLGVVLSVVYMLPMIQKVFHGKITNDANRTLKDLNPRELMVSVAFVFFMVWIGVAPGGFLNISEHASEQLLERLSKSHTQSSMATFNPN